MNEAWKNLLNIARSVHTTNEQLQKFCPFPLNIKNQNFESFHTEACNLMCKDKGLFTESFKEFRDSCIAVANLAHWRQTYKGTGISEQFLNKFGCYSIIGPNAPFTSNEMHAWLVYMPSDFYYPWHYHPAEEMYFCIAGEAIFRRENCSDLVISAGGIVEHSTNQAHAMQTINSPVMAYVIWRNEFDTRPQLSYADAR